MIDISKIKEKSNSPKTKKTFEDLSRKPPKQVVIPHSLFFIQEKKDYLAYSIISYSSKFQYIKSTKEGYLISFKSEVILQEQNDLNDLIIVITIYF